MKFWIRMWPHVAYRESLNESRSFVQALIDDLALELERLLALKFEDWRENQYRAFSRT